MRRKERVNDLMREVLSEIIRREIKDPRVGFLSVTDVEVAPDLSTAKVFVSVMGDEAAQKETMAVLQRAKGFLRTALAQQIRTMRQVPELIFKLDTSLQRGARVVELLEQAKREDAEIAALHPHEETEEDTASSAPGTAG